MAWLRNLTPGRKVVLKGNFDKRAQNKGGFFCFKNKMTNIAQNKSLQFALFIFEEFALYENRNS